MTELDRLKSRLDAFFASGVVDFKPYIDRTKPVSAETLAGEINRMLDAMEAGHLYQIDWGDDEDPKNRWAHVMWRPGETKRFIDGVLVYRSYADYCFD